MKSKKRGLKKRYLRPALMSRAMEVFSGLCSGDLAKAIDGQGVCTTGFLHT